MANYETKKNTIILFEIVIGGLFLLRRRRGAWRSLIYI